MNDLNAIAPELAAFADDRLITDVLYEVKSGKEATVYCCKADPKSGFEYLAAKVYKELTYRSFRNDSIYQEGRCHGSGQVLRAYEKKTEFGQTVQFNMWVAHEWETLRMMFWTGVFVPEPIAVKGRCILMEFFGQDGQAAPTLQTCEPPREMVGELWQLVLCNIERMLQKHVVHGDLSPYNLICDVERRDDPLRVIDFPQAVDARTNPNALALLERDLNNVYRWFSKRGVSAEPKSLARDLWRRYQRAEL
ncbi:MAG: hypothetical protein IT462_09410 [Planctomycetes bacterium]|nr:hypothetical protein [Planctomycetota bacterium]